MLVYCMVLPCVIVWMRTCSVCAHPGQPIFQAMLHANLQAVFKMAPADAVTLIRTGKSVLDGWHNTYMQVREKIEVSGRDARWEFSKPMLFELTNYMSEICSDLNEMVEIIDDFHKFLGPELKAVTGDSQVTTDATAISMQLCTCIPRVLLGIERLAWLA